MTSPPPIPDWLGPLSFLIVYVIAALALGALRSDAAPAVRAGP